MTSVTIQLSLFPLGLKRCSRCRNRKPLEDFPQSKATRDGRHCYCRACWREYNGGTRKTPVPQDVGIGVKQCAKCERVLSLTAFGKDARRDDGLFPYCKRCRLRDPIKRDQEAVARVQGLRRCNACKEWKSSSEFYTNPTSASGLHGQCKPCSRELSRRYAATHVDDVKRRAKRRWHNRKPERRAAYRRWYLANLEAVRARKAAANRSPAGRMRQARANHQRRVRVEMADSSLTPDEWRGILEQQENHCLGCARPFGPNLRPTIDHIIPVSKGGPLAVPNVQGLCKPCNSRKSARIMDLRDRSYPFR